MEGRKEEPRVQPPAAPQLLSARGARASQRQCLVTVAPSQASLPRCSNQAQVQAQAQGQPVALLLGRIRGGKVGTPLCRAPRYWQAALDKPPGPPGVLPISGATRNILGP